MIRWIAVILLIGANVLLWSVPTPQGLKVSFLDVGQGDAILIEGPTGVQVLVDGGAGSTALRELGERLPFWDRTLDAVVATHPDADHIGGLPEVLERYEVGYVLEPGLNNTTDAWSAFVASTNNEIESGARVVHPRRSIRLALGGAAHADVLYPAGDVVGIKDTNAGSVVMRLQYGDTAFMLTGDAPAEVEYEILRNVREVQSTVLKAGHHGSKTSSSEEFVSAVAPQYVVYSRGCDNRYGHPAAEVVDRFINYGVTALDTCEQGTVVFQSDGTTLRLLSSE